MGLPSPASLSLIAGSAYAGTTSVLSFQLWIIVAAAGGAIIGATIGFLVGGSFGVGLISRYGYLIFRTERRYKLVQYLYLKHGSKILILGRFFSITRACTPFLAGANRMDFRRFFPANLLGGVIWACALGLGGYYLGGIIRKPNGWLDYLLLALLVVGVIVCILYIIRNAQRLEEEAIEALPEPVDLGSSRSQRKQQEEREGA